MIIHNEPALGTHHQRVPEAGFVRLCMILTIHFIYLLTNFKTKLKNEKTVSVTSDEGGQH